MAQPPPVPPPLPPVVRPWAKPEKFTGSREADWTTWRNSYLQASRVNRWTPQEQADYVGLYLTGNAQSFLQSLPDATQRDNNLVFQALQDRFAPAGQVNSFRAELKARRQRPDEPLSDFCEAVRRLGSRAYPTVPAAVQNTLARDAFIDGLDSRELRLEVRRRSPDTLDEALNFAHAATAILVLERPESQPAHVVCAAATTPAMDSALMAIMKRLEQLETQLQQQQQQQQQQHGCGSPEHLIARCPKKAKQLQGN